MSEMSSTLVNVTLCANAESMGDLIRIIRPALAVDCICVHVAELRTVRGEMFDADLRIVFSSGNNKQAIAKMHKAIKAFVDIIEDGDDCHVIAESLNFESEYDGERMESSTEERIISNLQENTVVG